MTKPLVLVVEDEAPLVTLLRYNLEKEGFQVCEAGDGEEALIQIAERKPDLVLLDWMLPQLSGIEVCRRLREGRSIPILVLSARGAERDKVAALDAGADDYVTKPFGSEELLARVRAALRRSEGPAATAAGPIKRGDLAIDVDRRRVMRGADELRLTPKEFELLVFLAQHPGRVLTHRTILKAIWGPNAVGQPEHLRVLVNSLRRKLERDPARPQYILTEPWVGYRFSEE